MRKHITRILSLLMVFSLVGGTLTLTGCGGGKQEAEEEQDNCYGDDLPVTNEE